ncbi:MAG: F0F1 ATP synthase subunit B [Longimicrobiales bacterium]|jgi:F-type H+-transporting ATPase subunit b|nr:F0F1 ATP synthase subunit B [Longimicrobiales bacterium]
MKTSRIGLMVVALLSAPHAVWAQGGAEGTTPLFTVNLGTTVWTTFIFLSLLGILWKFAWGPILGAVEAREQGIQSTLDEAASRNEEAKSLLAEHKEQLADARRQANELIAEGKTVGDRVRKEIEEKARSEAQSIIERARSEIERERDAAIAELRKESVDLALAAATRLMQENLNQDKDRALVERYLAEMGSGGGAA